MEKIRLGVIFGGQSSEYSVSLHSAASVLRSIHTERYEVSSWRHFWRSKFRV